MVNRINEARAKRDQGFTLIELLVVIIVIGILAAIAIPVFLNQRQKGVDAGIKSDLKNAATVLETHTVDNPTWTATAADVTTIDTGFKATGDNVITVTGSGASGYVISGYNSGASTAVDAATAMTYDSNLGGLQ